MKKGDEMDPKGLIFEAYRMDGISAAECRTIFLDWALSLPAGQDTITSLGVLLGRYGDDFPDHPMTQILTDGRTSMNAPRRRGGWRSRTRN
ncbi:hypothetical protein JQV19_08925 [Sulfitobacter mediterraneus]|uniref:hypothetical protein n=1 Tax=Sulfitobacter mediterraneus TaxID=83219 RepID=UPI00193A5D14|nr:hypothetical protein [Sulfitobacter mediterraneus]MBM1556769.1 hypothetical protein [Sulfitobacter mediterraneus]MBM1568953.1 hypothetical protein [Sulfitobacter mediterraneus]MBM1572381.1 hypothetical protein [Sulfitobacter mediterraneus]MBM1576544.1 hypothetical protein [Sulfitobacter mediterraneus]MBM1579727.1 hypothetical protein [Sulfitobacter mediterraneus]